ncbi:MAG: PLP-dependent aminotransferase family protein [Armatimonadetes bacterium]|nr:PLP-dependent aminotransferase family protein [Armatimonadota bacterium]
MHWTALDIRADRQRREPLYRQIVAHLREEIRGGRLPPGTRLPPTRILARQLGVTRLTVVNAYAELEADGLVTSHVGRGTFVAGTDGETPVARTWPPSATPGRPATELLDEFFRMARGPGVIAIHSPTALRELVPVKELQRAMAAVLRREGAEAVGYDAPGGYAPLREWLGEHLSEIGIRAAADSIVITAGTQQAIDLVTKLLVQPGDVVFTDSPTYVVVIDLLEARGARIIGVPMDAEGARLDIMETLIVRYRPRLFFTMPTFHNPTGITMSLERRRRLVTLARRHQLPVLEDDVHRDLWFTPPPPPLRALDRHGVVLYASGLTKSLLLGGLRLGFLVVPPEVKRQFVTAKQAADLHTNSLIQRVMDTLLRQGRLERPMVRLRQALQARRDRMVDALEREMPEGIRWTVPEGGYHLWLSLPPGISGVALYRAAIQHGVAVAPGMPFFPDREDRGHARLTFAVESPAAIDQGVRRLATAARQLLRARRPDDSRDLRRPVI